MTLNVKFDPILGKLRESDVGLVSVASVPIPDPLVINNLQVVSTASIKTIYANNIYASTISTGLITSVGVVNTSTISTNFIRSNNAVISNATIGLAHISNIDWNLTSGGSLVVEGQMNWDANQQTVVIGMPGGNVDLALGMETLFPRRVRNSTGSTMPKGTVVYINGVSGNTPTVERAIATLDMSSAFTLGMTAESIGNGATGWVTTFGELTGLDLSAYTGGDTLYLSGATAGAFTNVPQSAPIHYVRVGTVVKATTDGALVVNVINGYEINELHNVAITSLASGQILQSGVSNLWYNVTPNFVPSASYPSLGSLAIMNALSYGSLISKPSLGSLAVLDNLSFTSLTNLPSLGSLAVLNELSYGSLISKPSLGSLAILDNLSFTSLTNLPSLGSLAVLNELSYGSLISKPSLGSLAVLDNLSYTSLLNQPSLGSLAIISNIAAPLSLSGLTLSLSQASIVHNNLGGLTTGDPHTQYALLAGRSGGQILRGGTDVNDLLILRGTSANGNTVTSNAIRMGVGNGGGTYAWNLRHNGTIAQTATTTTSGDAYTLGYNVSGTTGDSIALFMEISDTGGGSKTIYAHRARTNYLGSGTIQGVQATSNQINISNGGTVNYAEVLTSNFTVNNSTVGEANLIRLFSPTNSGGSIALLRGLYIENINQATTNWSIYSEGGNMYHAGYIGIGTTTPSTKLEIDDSNPNLNRITIDHSAGYTSGYVGYQWQVDGAYAGGLYRNSSTNDVNIWTQGSGAAARFNVANNGRIGIGMGVTAPAAQTHIDQSSTTAAIPVLTLDQADLSEEFINFVGTVGVGNSIQSSASVGVLSTKVRVAVNGTFRFLYLYNS